MTKKITKEQIEEMVMSSLKEAIENNPELINEGWFRDLGRGISGAASKVGNRAAGFGNSMMAGWKQGQANGTIKDIDAQMAKSQQIINRENQKIKDLKTKKYNLQKAAYDYQEKANQNYAKANVNTRVTGYDKPVYDRGDLSKNTWSTDQQFANRQKRQQRKQQSGDMGLVAEAIEKAWKKYAAIG